MYRYSRYIARKLVWSTVLVTVSLTSIIWLTQALRFIDFMVNRGVAFSDFLKLTLLLIPSLLMLILPIAIACAVIFVYTRMNMDSELVVLGGAGLSRWQVAKPAVIVAAVFMLVTYSISLYFMPSSYREFKDMQVFLRDHYASLLLQEDVFNTPVEGMTVFVREREGNGTLHGILVHDSRTPERPVTMMAEKGELVQTSQGPRFILVNGNRQEMYNKRISMLYFERYDLDLSFYTAKVGDRSRESNERYLGELFTDRYRSIEERNELRAEGHQRIAWPFYCMTLSLIALCVLLSGEFNRRGQWQRIAVTLSLMLTVAVAAIGLTALVSKHAMLFPLMYVNALLLAAIGAYVLLAPNVLPYKPIKRRMLKGEA